MPNREIGWKMEDRAGEDNCAKQLLPVKASLLGQVQPRNDPYHRRSPLFFKENK